MQCPCCQNTSNRVLESRSTEAGKSIRRRRECLNCQNRFTTYERVEFIPLTVIKKDGKKESFDRSKILKGMVRACEKTEISTSTLESIVDEIEMKIQQLPAKEITSQKIGELVLKQLKNKSEVAYIRFASVYGRFQGINDFVSTLKNLQKEIEEDNWKYNIESSTQDRNTTSFKTTPA